MKKIYLAIAHEPLEVYLQKKLDKEYLFCGVSVHRDSVLKGIAQKSPDILIIRETLDGSIDILTLIHEIRKRHSNVRIIFLAGRRTPGDAILSTLVGLGVWDILFGDKVQADNIIKLVRNKNEYRDIAYLQPVPVMNGRESVGFVAPEAEPKEVVKEVIKEVEVVKEVEVIKEVEKEVIVEKIIDNSGEAYPVKSGSKDFMNKIFGSTNKSKEYIENIVQSKQIFSFMGGKGGVGTTTVAYNTAISLASKGYKTIYIEFNDVTPSVSYWLNVGFTKDGIDSALKAIEKDELQLIDDAIIKSAELSVEERELQDVYKLLPKTIDFMFFSDAYITKSSESLKDINYELVKELVLYLVFQKNYDFVVLDLSGDVNHPLIKNALMYSNQLVMNITQDISSIGYAKNKLKQLSDIGYEISKNPIFVLNKFTNSKFKPSYLKDWLQGDRIVKFNDINAIAIDSNLSGVPLYLNKKNVKYINSINVLMSQLIQK